MKNNNQTQKNSQENDDDIPDLDDMTEELNNIRLKQGTLKTNTDSEIKVEYNNPPNEVKKQEPIKKQEGGLFKKGFLLRGEKKVEKKEEIPSRKEMKKDILDLTHLKPKTKEETLLLDDVQKNMNTQNILADTLNKKEEWLNQELIMKIAKSPNLLKYFMDPRFQEVISLMQKDPQRAKDLYGGNPEFNTFFKEFSSVMAEHFNKLSEKKQIPLSYNADPEINAILNDSKVKPILERMKNEGKIDILEIQKDEYISKRINILIDKGILILEKL
jgi:hypothetical protein